MSEMNFVKAIVTLNNSGGYDGARNMKFPLTIEGQYCRELGYVDVPIAEIEKHGYDRFDGHATEFPDAKPQDKTLCWIVGCEATVVEVLE